MKANAPALLAACGLLVLLAGCDSAGSNLYTVPSSSPAPPASAAPPDAAGATPAPVPVTVTSTTTTTERTTVTQRP